MNEVNNFDPESIKKKIAEITETVRNLNPRVNKSLELFGSFAPRQKNSDSVDQFIGNLRIWYYGTDPYADQRMGKMEEVEKFLMGHVSGNPFRDGDLEVLNRYIKESREQNNKDKK